MEDAFCRWRACIWDLLDLRSYPRPRGQGLGLKIQKVPHAGPSPILSFLTLREVLVSTMHIDKRKIYIKKKNSILRIRIIKFLMITYSPL